MHRVRQRFGVLAAAAALLFGGTTAAFANHDHYLVTPGTCVADVARGQTAKAEGEGGGHQFHNNVHLGTPGTTAFANENNPVSVGKGACPAPTP